MAKHPSAQDIKVATDAAIFTVKDGALQLLLIKMKKKPFEGRWALPGGLLGDDETAEDAVRRILKGQSGVTGVYLEQLATFDAHSRDPFGRVVSIAYVALIPNAGVKLHTTAKYADVRWTPVSKLPKLAYDHTEITKAAVARLRAKLGYANVAWSLLPAEFPLSRLQDIYEIILGRPLDKRNFLKKILSLKLLEDTGKKGGGAHRPAKLYRFRKKAPALVDIL